jgi:hypothetical protein
MPWVVSVSVDADKTNVGTATATFTDPVDNTPFTYSERALLTAGNAPGFVTRAVAARNAWQTTKTRETNAASALVTNFGTAGETATAAPAV